MATNTYVALQTTTLTSSAASVTFNSIPQGYTDFICVGNYQFVGTGQNAVFFYVGNGSVDTGTNYSDTYLDVYTGSPNSGRNSNANFGLFSYCSSAGLAAGANQVGIMHFLNYSNTTTYKTTLSRNISGSDMTSAYVNMWRSTAAIDTLRLNAQGSNFASGSTFTLYGVAAATQTYPINPPVTGYSLWLDASDSTSITQSSNLISQWNDKSGNGKNFTSSGSLRPTYVTNSLVNGLPTISFAGGQGLTTSTFPFASSAFTIFTVQKTSGAGVYQGIFEQIVSGGVGIGVSGATGYYSLFKARIAPYDYSGNVSPTTTNYDVYVTKSAGMSGGAVTASAYKNGTSIGSASFTGGSTANGAAVGYDGNAGDYTTMSLCEILVYPSELSNTDRNSVEAYLKTKWGTP